MDVSTVNSFIPEHNDKMNQREDVDNRHNKNGDTRRRSSFDHFIDTSNDTSSEDLLEPEPLHYSHSRSQNSNFDCLLGDSDWSDISFCALPSFQRQKLKKVTQSSSFIGSSVTPSHYSDKVYHVFPEVQSNSSLPELGKYRWHNKQYYNPNYKHPLGVMNRREMMNHKPEELSRYTDTEMAESDDTIGRSSSGIASDIDSPRSIRSDILLETSSGLPNDTTATSSLRPPIKALHLVQSNVNLWNHTHKGLDSLHASTDGHFVATINTGIPCTKQCDKMLYSKLKDESVNRISLHNNFTVLNNDVRSSFSLVKEKNVSRNLQNWKHVSMVNCLSPVWNMKLLESTPAFHPQLLKARLFRRWHLRARLKRLDRIENDNKTNKAVEFLHNTILKKYFKAWMKLQQDQLIKADSLYHKHLTQMGIKGLQFAVQIITKARSDASRQIDSHHKAKYWLKWQKHMTKRKAERLRSAFNRWRVLHLQGNRDKILEGIANKHIMSRSYIKWKMKYSVEQNNSVAGLNFQITLLTKCWHSWRIYVAQRVVKTRTNEVARIQYENNIQARVFRVWLAGRNKFSTAKSLARRRVVVKAFCSWRNWTQYAKVIHQRFQSMCKEYYSRTLLRQNFVKWKQRLMLRKANKYHEKLLQKRVYSLWFLRHRRKVIHRHLCKAMAKKGKKRRFLHKWLNITQSQQDRRKEFVKIFHKMLLSKIMLEWKDHTQRELSRRKICDHLRQKKDALIKRKAMDHWIFAVKVANFKKQAKISWSKRCARKACFQWKLLLKKKHLEHTLIESRPVRDFWLLRAFWNAWRKEKDIADNEHEHANSAMVILARNFKRRVFQAWRVINQQEQIIAPTVTRKQHKNLARVFDAWRLYVYRLKYVVDKHKRNGEKVQDKHFVYWREKAFLQIKEREATTRLRCSKLTRAFFAWQDYIRKTHFERLQQRAQTLQLLSVYFKKWSERAMASLDAKEQVKSQQAQKQLVLIWAFKYWKNAAVSQRQHLLEVEEKVVFNIRHLQLRRCMAIWHRAYTVAAIARNYQANCQKDLLHKVFNAWSTFIKDEMNEKVKIFSSNFQDCSMGSTGGSFLRSTLESSGSDFLSSGYWTTRRGSGSVFRSPAARQRDDDVASLPGRFDQIHPDSPRFRSASPITLIRECNNVASPLVAHTPSSSPSPSPPDLHLSLPTSTTSSESVFSAFKEDSLHFKSDLEPQHSVEDEFECMSITSGLSSASVRDKEMVVIDTIRHWQCLPLSLTFRPWLKYTRQRKLLRELLYFAREKKSHEIINTTLRQWRRELYITVAARQYACNSKRLRCLRAWRVYMDMCRMKDKCTKSAVLFNRSFLLKMVFNSWKTKCAAKKKLQSIVCAWQKKAVVTDKYKAIEEKIHTQCNQHDISRRFHYWLLMTHKSQEAKLYYLERLLPRFFLAWHQYSCTRTSHHKKALWFREQRVLTLAFREWRKRFEFQVMAHEFVEAKEVNFTVEMIKSWHDWANGVSTRRRLWRIYHKSLQIKTLKEIFTAWLGQVKHKESAKKMYEHSLLRSVLLSWQAVNCVAQENKSKASKFKLSCAARQLRQTFIFWRRFFSHRQLGSFHALQREKTLVKNCFKQWRNFILKNRAEKFFMKCMLEKVFLQWYEGCLGRKKARHLLRSWRNVTNASKALNNKATEVCRLTDTKILHHAFMFWIQETHKIQKAKQHYATIASRSSFFAWYNYVHTKAQCRKTLFEAKIAKNKTLLAGAFLNWREGFLRKLATQDTLDEYLQTKQLLHLQCCMLKWKKYTNNCRSHKHYSSRLVSKNFLLWKHRLLQKKGLEAIMEKVFYRRITRAAIHWKQWIIKTKQQRCQADEFQVNVGSHAVQMSFSYWLMATKKSCRAKKQYNMAVLKRALFLLKNVVKNKRKQREIKEEFQKQRTNKKVAVLLLRWKCEMEESKRNIQLINNQRHKQNKHVLCGCMRQWKKYTKKSRADKHYNVVLVAQSFLDWKSRFEERQTQKDKDQAQSEKALKHYRNRLSRMCLRSWYNDICVQKYLEMKQQLLLEIHFKVWKKKSKLKSIASELGDHQTYCLYWGKWRNQLVRKRVAELMMKHEEKKLLSEVFGSWYKLTMIQRRLLKEWQTFLTEKWFRRWMQKYNES